MLKHLAGLASLTLACVGASETTTTRGFSIDVAYVGRLVSYSQTLTQEALRSSRMYDIGNGDPPLPIAEAAAIGLHVIRSYNPVGSLSIAEVGLRRYPSLRGWLYVVTVVVNPDLKSSSPDGVVAEPEFVPIYVMFDKTTIPRMKNSTDTHRTDAAP